MLARSLAPKRSAFLTCLLLALLAWLFFPNLYNFVDGVRQTGPWSSQRAIESSFEPTTTELACLNGRASALSSTHHELPAPIPNVVHFIYGLRNPATSASAGTFGFLEYLAVRSAVVALKPDAIYLHYTYLSDPPDPDPSADPLTNAWIKRLSKDITLVHHPPSEFTEPPYGSGAASGWQAAHVSDIMRLQILHAQGGIYLDIDAFALRSFDTLLLSPRDMVLGHEGGNRWGLCNAIMAARANSSFAARWLASYKTADLSREWNYHSVLLPKEMMADGHEEEVCALAPGAFFWPTWTWRHVDYMHEELGAKEAEWWKEEIGRNGGSLFEGQVAYHAWNQMSQERYLRYLTPGLVGAKNTRFNLLMRRFIEDDVY